MLLDDFRIPIKFYFKIPNVITYYQVFGIAETNLVRHDFYIGILVLTLLSG